MKCFVAYFRGDHSCRGMTTDAMRVVCRVEWMELFAGVERSERSFVIVHTSGCCDAIKISISRLRDVCGAHFGMRPCGTVHCEACIC